MKRIGVDTNVILSLVTDRDPSQQERAAGLFAAALAGEHVVVVHQTVISEVAYVMCSFYGIKPGKVRAALRDVLALPGVVAIDALDWSAVWKLWPRSVKDLGDACLVAVGKSDAFDALATFDVAFSKRLRRQGLSTYW